MRKYLKQGVDATASYIRFHKLEDITLKTYQGIFKEVTTEQIGTGEGLEREIFLKTSDGMHRSIVFDAVELMDTYIPFQTEG
jgi:hypothetical protein